MTVVQRTPNLGIGIRLQRVAPAPPPAPTPEPTPGCSCEATGVAWLVQPTYEADEYGEVWWDTPSLDPYQITELDEYGTPVIDWDTPQGPDFIRIRMPVVLPYSADPAVTLVAIATGPQTRGVEWTVERAGGTFPIDVDTTQSHVTITLQPFETDGSANQYEDITLTARCGDTVVGTLRLQVYVEGW